jgi:hypothetical protein
MEGRRRLNRNVKLQTRICMSQLLVVKDHAFCCEPAVELWSRELPAISFAPVVTTAL